MIILAVVPYTENDDKQCIMSDKVSGEKSQHTKLSCAVFCHLNRTTTLEKEKDDVSHFFTPPCRIAAIYIECSVNNSLKRKKYRKEGKLTDFSAAVCFRTRMMTTANFPPSSCSVLLPRQIIITISQVSSPLPSHSCLAKCLRCCCMCFQPVPPHTCFTAD